jgi:hypothetical protein
MKCLNNNDKSQFEVILVEGIIDHEPTDCKVLFDGHLTHIVVEGTDFSRARYYNLGVDKAKGDTLFLMDADIILCPSFISDLTAWVAQGHLNDHFAVSTMLYLSVQSSINIMGKKYSNAERDTLIKTVKELKSGVKHTFNWFESHAFLGKLNNTENNSQSQTIISKKGFESIGGFDNRYCGYGIEDCDLHDRMMRKYNNKKIGFYWNFHPEFMVYHLWHGPSAPENLALMTDYALKNAPHNGGIYNDNSKARKIRVEQDHSLYPKVIKVNGY